MENNIITHTHTVIYVDFIARGISVQYVVQFTLLYLLPVNMDYIIHALNDIILYIYVS